VSIITPTCNRRKFLPWLIDNIKQQTYPREYMEWVVYDDGTDSIRDVLEPHMATLKIRYIREETKANIGVKRNRLHAEAQGDILVTMDDDDYYPPERVAHAVRKLLTTKVEICGSSRNHMLFTDDKSIWEVGPYAPYHATFGTMAFKKSYTLTHSCDESVTFAEELSFTNRYSSPLAQLDPMKTMLVICHSQNTFNKDKLRKEGSPAVKKTQLGVKSFIKSKAARDFYTHA